MTEPMLAAERCDCCPSPGTTSTGHCATAAALRAGCDCELRAGSGNQPAQPAVAQADGKPTVDIALIPAALSTPQRVALGYCRAAAPPGAGTSVSRPLLCTWII